ncbi:trypsin-like peptidase domain-containing protein [Magnetofaba australis]|uniref:Putative serine protease n=1 Tax=Magnetofaba australis IT-1 TaxID=1434232 RepID=A0A1Y2K1Y0_9PROT|nr:trypsin-like peptidase domain-containing protein [Magnetofaba australis]OSM02040.1 putative serine protease [Magnetofaba australis IT-1]
MLSTSWFLRVLTPLAALFVALISTAQAAPGLDWAEIVSRYRDGVVRVTSHATRQSVLQPFLGPEPTGATRGAAFFIDDAGHLLTNAHVLGGVQVNKEGVFIRQPASIVLTTPRSGFDRFEAQLVAIFEKGDVALLKLKEYERERFLKMHGGKITVLKLADSDQLAAGEGVVALGYPTEHLTVTEGIVSGFTRSASGVYQFIQTNSALNPGNSGGPSLDGQGGVIGINSKVRRKSENIGFIIPINAIKSLLPGLREGQAQFPALGIGWRGMDANTAEFLGMPEKRGILLTRVEPGGAADAAGLRRLDVITQLGDSPINFRAIGQLPNGRQMGLAPLLRRYANGQTLPLRFYRDGALQQTDVTLQPYPEQAIGDLRLGDPIDYEIWGGAVFQPLNVKILSYLTKYRGGGLVEWLAPYRLSENRGRARVVITHVFDNSPVHRSRKLGVGDVILSANGEPIETLADLRAQLARPEPIAGGSGENRAQRFVTLEVEDGSFAAFSRHDVARNEARLKMIYGYERNRPAFAESDDGE